MDKLLSKDGTPIAFVTVGDGAPVILVGGALNDHTAKAAGLPLAEHLRTRYQVIAYDRRGRGASGDTAPYAIDREIEDLAALVAHAGGAAFVYGMSSGAILALEAARVLPITRLALFEPPYLTGGHPGLPPAYRERLAAHEDPGDAVAQFLGELVQLPAPAVAHMRAQPFWPHLAAFGPSLLHDADITGDGSMPEREHFASVTMPTLIVDGGASPTWMRGSMRALASRLPSATHLTLAGQTHDVDPAPLAAALVDFFG